MVASIPQTEDGSVDLKKGTQLLEIYALEIQMYTAQKNNKKLKALYEQSLQIKSAIPHPLIMGVIRGKRSKVYMGLSLSELVVCYTREFSFRCRQNRKCSYC